MFWRDMHRQIMYAILHEIHYIKLTWFMPFQVKIMIFIRQKHNLFSHLVIQKQIQILAAELINIYKLGSILARLFLWSLYLWQILKLNVFSFEFLRTPPPPPWLHMPHKSPLLFSEVFFFSLIFILTRPYVFWQGKCTYYVDAISKKGHKKKTETCSKLFMSSWLRRIFFIGYKFLSQ